MLSLEKIYEKFEAKGDFLQASELNSGHINNTYLVETKEGKPNYVLQQINHKVFPDIPALMQNKILVSQYLKNNSRQNQVHLQFIKAYSGQYFYKDQTDYYWNMMEHIPNSKVLEKTENTQQAKEAGRGFGGFISALHNFDASQLHEVIKDFHKMSFRFEEFDHALKNAQTSYKDNAKNWIKQATESRAQMHQLQYLYEAGEIPQRVTHNDTKLSNILFDNKDNMLCVIDLDTLMPGIVHYDFGDSVRTICSTSTEDETDLAKVQFNMDFYQAFRNAFLKEMENKLSDLEIQLLPLAAQTITFIMGLRFLTDYLNGSIYYKTKYPEHNLHRAANQFTLARRIALEFKNTPLL